MSLNNLKENRKFQIIVCVTIGVISIFYQIYLEKESDKILKEIEKSNDNFINQLKSI